MTKTSHSAAEKSNLINCNSNPRRREILGLRSATKNDRHLPALKMW
jgi:hypothetical protein